MKRNILNLVMLAGILIAFDYRYTENRLHEILGVILGGCFLWHNYLNIIWYKKLSKLQKQPLAMGLMIVNIGLAAAMLVTIITGGLISHTVMPNRLLRNSLWVHDLHTIGAYMMLIFSGLHLGFHWRGLWMRFCRWSGLKYEGNVRLAGRFAASATAVYGIVVSFSYQIGDRLLMRHVFVDWNAEPVFWQFIFEYAAVFALYVWLANFAVGWLQCRKCGNSVKKGAMEHETA